MIYLFSKAFELKYKYILKPIFFVFDPETIHNLMVKFGSWAVKIPFVKDCFKLFFAYQNKKLNKNIHGINFPNPIGLSAGFDYNADLTQVLPSLGFGFHIIGTVTYLPYEGNPKPRLARLPNSKSLIVNKGLKNIGVPAIIRKLRNKTFHIPTAFSIASTNKHFDSTKDQIVDILASFKLLEESGLKHSFYELNISCPNTFGGEPFTSPDRLEILLSCLDRLAISKPISIKMPIDQSQQETLALLKVIDKHNIQMVNMGNLTKDKTNPDIKPNDREIWKRSRGNLSGKPTWNRSNNLIALTKKHYLNRFTIIGTGGVFNGQDAKEKINQGADLIGLITGMIFEGPQMIGQANKFIAEN